MTWSECLDEIRALERIRRVLEDPARSAAWAVVVVLIDERLFRLRAALSRAGLGDIEEQLAPLGDEPALELLQRIH